MTLQSKSRVLRSYHRTAYEDVDYSASGHGTATNTLLDQTVYSRQVTRSEGHAWPRDRGVRDAGGDFDTVKLSFYPRPAAEGQTGKRFDSLGWTRIRGHAYAYPFGLHPAWTSLDPANDPFAAVPISGESQLMAKGSEFIAQSIPTNPIASGSVALAELYRDGIPAIIGGTLLKGRVEFLRSLGSEYLNIEFGWKPLISDLKSAAKAIIDSDDVLQQLVRDSGRDVHRKRYSPEVRSVLSITTSSTQAPNGIPNYFYSSPPTYREADVNTRRNSFSGCFTYHYDPGQQSEVERIVTQARLLYGLELTPEVLWNIAPWSWLVDWVTNVGPVLHNLSAFQSDGLVMRYGYVMEFNHRKITRSYVDGTNPFGSTYPKQLSDVYSGVRKTRRKATPFGFGLDVGGFSDRQWLILAALGITRAPRTL